MSDRLDAYLSHRGFGSRREVRNLIHSGRVRLNGKRTVDHGAAVKGGEVLVHNQPVKDAIYEATLLLNKPLGHACSHDPSEAPLIDELVPQPYAHLTMNTAGRLDRDTSGLLVLTTDGPLIHRLTNPKRHLEKRYRVDYSGTLSAHAVDRVAKGIQLEDDPKPTLPAELQLEAPGTDGLGRATLLLSEGRYHQVRRMFAALGATVERLHRDRIGDLDLPADLAPGDMRPITADELALLQGHSLHRPEGQSADPAEGAPGGLAFPKAP